MNDDMKMILFSDLHYLDDNHKEKTNRKLTKLAIPVIEKLIYEINQKIKHRIDSKKFFPYNGEQDDMLGI